jgi:hypothetical protein
MALNPLDRLPASLPNVARASLPKTYQGAKNALAKCIQVDECKKWKDKAQALASYAKQSQDDDLLQLARRIQARAVRRCGELLGEIERSEKGGRPKKNGAGTDTVSHRQAARHAGLSKRQQTDARRVANIPASRFETLVEGKHPPTITVLAEEGKKPRPLVDLGARTPVQFKAAGVLFGLLDRFVRQSKEIDLKEAIKGLTKSDRTELHRNVRVAARWLDSLEGKL